MSQSISITVPYNHLAISSAASMLTKLAEDIKNETATPVATKKVLTEADALADLNGEPRPDNPSLEATLMQNAELREENSTLKEANSYEPMKAVDDAKAVFAPPPPVAETPAPPAPPAPVETEEANADLDANGLPWDARIHAATKTKDKAGKWKYLRGVDRDVLVPEVEAELRALVGEPVEDEPAPVNDVPTPPAAPTSTTPTPGNPAGIPPVDHGTPSKNVTTFAQLVTGITTNNIPEDKVKEALDKVRIANFALLGARADLIPTVAGHLGL